VEPMNSVLFNAASHDQMAVVERLVMHHPLGLSLDCNTAFRCAARNGHVPVVKLKSC
jgi:Ankyrin repeats (many copies)